jgi:hypothetical protein
MWRLQLLAIAANNNLYRCSNSSKHSPSHLRRSCLFAAQLAACKYRQMQNVRQQL